MFRELLLHVPISDVTHLATLVPSLRKRHKIFMTIFSPVFSLMAFRHPMGIEKNRWKVTCSVPSSLFNGALFKVSLTDTQGLRYFYGVPLYQLRQESVHKHQQIFKIFHPIFLIFNSIVHRLPTSWNITPKDFYQTLSLFSFVGQSTLP